MTQLNIADQPDDENLLDIPPFLRRDTGPKRPVQDRPEKRTWWMPDLQEHKRKREEKRRRQQEREETKQARAERKSTQRESRDAVIAAIRGGHDTFGKMCKHIDMDPADIRRGMRYLLKHGRIVKASPRRYKEP